MDTITHGITGALIGKAFFAEWQGPAPDGAGDGRVATFAATLGAIFPDSDVIAELFSKNNLATLELHRGFTHSFVCLPLFALALAGLTCWFARRREIRCPDWTRLALIYATGLAVHIVLDLLTSFGTMIWSPLSNARAAWDLTFIIDFLFTGIVLLPQATAWVYRRRERHRRRGLLVWVFFSLCAVGIERLARTTGVPFSPWVVLVASLVMAALFFLPAWGGWGFGVRRASWCRAGVYALAAYLGLSATAHQVALHRVEKFAATQELTVERMGALPMPPSPAYWSGLIRTPDGVWQSWFSLLERQPPAFRFFGDSPPNGYTEAVKQLPEVRTYLWFARFPVVRYSQRGDRNVVELTDRRFVAWRSRRTSAFTFRVTIDSAGRVLDQGWVED